MYSNLFFSPIFFPRKITCFFFFFEFSLLNIDLCGPALPGTFLAPLALDFFRRRWTRGSLKSGKTQLVKSEKRYNPNKTRFESRLNVFCWMGYYISWFFFWMGKAGWTWFFVLLDGDKFLASVSWVEALRYEPWGLRTLVWVKYEIVQWQKKAHIIINQLISEAR